MKTKVKKTKKPAKSKRPAKTKTKTRKVSAVKRKPLKPAGYRFEVVKAPLRYALNSLLHKQVPARLVPDGVYQTDELAPFDLDELHSFCARHCVLNWFTGIGVLEAAELLVRESVSNGNIADKMENPHCWTWPRRFYGQRK